MAVGVAMHFYVLKDMARTLVLPPLGLLILAVLGAVLLWLRRPRAGWTCLILGLGLLWMLSTALVADELTRLTQVYPAFDPSKPTNAQAIVILGGGEGRFWAPEYGGRPATSMELLERLNYGGWLSRVTHLPVLVTSDPGNALQMAVSLRRDFQVPPRWVEWHSRDTYDNARNSAAMLHADNVHSILLVTSSAHMLRAMREFLATGLQVTAAPVHVLGRRGYGPTDYLPSAEAMILSNRAVYELVGERVRELLAVLHLRRQHPL
jgi:uncharacterized SAM-binding protein YcdF (DUF218 family)